MGTCLLGPLWDSSEGKFCPLEAGWGWAWGRQKKTRDEPGKRVPKSVSANLLSVVPQPPSRAWRWVNCCPCYGWRESSCYCLQAYSLSISAIREHTGVLNYKLSWLKTAANFCGTNATSVHLLLRQLCAPVHMTVSKVGLFPHPLYWHISTYLVHYCYSRNRKFFHCNIKGRKWNRC